MNYNDSQVLAEIEYTAKRDRRVKDDIKKAIDSHDRAFFAEVVYRVLHRLHRTVADITSFIDMAYERFRNRL